MLLRSPCHWLLRNSLFRLWCPGQQHSSQWNDKCFLGSMEIPLVEIRIHHREGCQGGVKVLFFILTVTFSSNKNKCFFIMSTSSIQPPWLGSQTIPYIIRASLPVGFPDRNQIATHLWSWPKVLLSPGWRIPFQLKDIEKKTGRWIEMNSNETFLLASLPTRTAKDKDSFETVLQTSNSWL